MAAAEYRLALGSLTAAALNASSAYLIENFAVQSDQGSALKFPWGPPSDNGTTYPRNARYTDNADGSQSADGFITFSWVLAYLTEGMLSFFESTYFPSGASSAVTVKTLKSNGSFQVYQAIMKQPIPNEHYRRGDRGVEDYLLRFVNGVAV